MKKSGWMIALLMFGCLLTVGCHKEESMICRSIISIQKKQH